MKSDFLHKILLSNLTKFFPKTINRKLLRKFKIFFIPTKLNKLPINHYPVFTSFKKQEAIYFKFQKQKKLIVFNSIKNIDNFIKKIIKNKKLSFLDVGGDNIDLYLSLHKKTRLSHYYIYNLKGYLDIFSLLKKKFNLKNFFLLRNVIKIKKIDFVYFGASIQYFKDYKNFLLKIIKKKPKYIFFASTSFILDNIKEDSLVVKQTNILPNLVYCYFFNFYSFKNFFERNNYKLIFFQKNKYAKINYNNFKPTYKKIKYLDVLFIKKD